jgi:hypothetical protein
VGHRGVLDAVVKIVKSLFCQGKNIDYHLKVIGAHLNGMGSGKR